jgi:hypothetical protein
MANDGGLMTIDLNDERLVSCTSKVRHETAAKAHSVMKRSPYVKKLNVYHCKYCGKFHIGHKLTRKG